MSATKLAGHLAVGSGVSNYRQPQLTYAEDHPGEELPAFHFAVTVTP